MIKELLRDALPIIEKSAPLIATSLGSPLAGGAISLLETVFNGSIKNPTDLVTKILTDPNVESKLQKCNDHVASHLDNLSSLWISLGRPIKLNIEWPAPTIEG